MIWDGRKQVWYSLEWGEYWLLSSGKVSEVVKRCYLPESMITMMIKHRIGNLGYAGGCIPAGLECFLDLEHCEWNIVV